MKIRVHVGSIAPMLAECRKAKSQGFFDEDALRSILEHPATSASSAAAT